MKGAEHERLMPAVAQCCERAGVERAATFERVVCGAGPGSFTSLRIAGAIAKGSASGVGCPLFAVPSMALIVGGAQLPGGPLSRGGRCAARRVLRRAVRGRARPGRSPSSSRVRLVAAAAPSTSSRRDVGARVVSPSPLPGAITAAPRARAVARLERMLVAPARWTSASWEPCVRPTGRGAGQMGVGARRAAVRRDERARSRRAERGRPSGDRRDRAACVQRSLVGRNRFATRSIIRRCTSPVLAVTATAVVGYVVAWFVADEGRSRISRSRRTAVGQGIGGALLDAALDEGVRRGAWRGVSSRCGTRTSGRGGCTASRGFEEVDGGEATIDSPDEDAIVLRRTLSWQVSRCVK